MGGLSVEGLLPNRYNSKRIGLLTRRSGICIVRSVRFNLLVDVIIAGLVFYFTRRSSWLEGYQAGEQDAQDHAERAGDHFYDQVKEGW